METTANRIKEAMALREMRQADLVEKTNISKGALSSYITGRYTPKQNNIYIIAKALNVNEAWLMGYDVPMERNTQVNVTSINAHDERDITEALNCIIKEIENGDKGPLYFDGTEIDEKSVEFLGRAIQLTLREAKNRVKVECAPNKNKIQSTTDSPKEQEHLLPQAAHERTDIEVTDDMRKHDDDIMDDDAFWNK